VHVGAHTQQDEQEIDFARQQLDSSRKSIQRQQALIDTVTQKLTDAQKSVLVSKKQAGQRTEANLPQDDYSDNGLSEDSNDEDDDSDVEDEDSKSSEEEEEGGGETSD
jgi:hypothetical protein